METTNQFSFNKPAMAGFGLMIIPGFFWLAVIMQTILHINYLMDGLLTPIFKSQPCLPFLVILGFPVVACIINTVNVIRIKLDLTKTAWTGTVTLNMQVLNILIIIASALSIALLVAYLIADNLVISIRP